MKNILEELFIFCMMFDYSFSTSKTGKELAEKADYIAKFRYIQK